MKKIAIIITLLSVSLTFAFGQTNADSIVMKTVFGGFQFYQGETKLNMQQLVNTMKPNELAYNQIKSAQSTYVIETILSGAGGFMIGWPIGAALGGGDPNWTMAGIGVGLIVVSIPINHRFNTKARGAVDQYNGGLETSSFWNESELKFSFLGNGVGLTLQF